MIIVHVQENEIAEFEQKYNESMDLLQGAFTRLTDNLALWKDEWRHLSDTEKSVFCPPASPEADTIDPVETPPLAAVETPAETPPASTESCKPVETSSTAAASEQLTPAPDEVLAVAMSASPGRKTGTAAPRCSGTECDVDDEDEDDDDDPSRNKKWNCYTVFIKEGLRDIRLTKVRRGFEVKNYYYT